MSILSVFKNRLLKGDDPLTAFRDAKTQADAWASGILKNVPPEVAPMVNALVADVKQGASDLAGQAEDAFPTILNDAAPVVDDLFAKLAVTYLGPIVGGMLSKAEVDGYNRIENYLINQIKSAKLTHLAAATGAAAPPAPLGGGS